MFCRNCGIDMAEELKFCPKCGTPVDPDELHPYGSASTGYKNRTAVLAAEEVGQTPKKKPLWILILLAIAAVAVVACMILGSHLVLQKVHKINLNKYVKDVAFDGYDTIGRAYVEYDSQKLYEDIVDNASNVPEAMSGDYDAWMSSIMGIRYEVVESEHLSNGDVVVLTFDVDEEKLQAEYGIRVKYEEKEYKVDGLERAELVDIYEGVSISYEGINPVGCAYLYNEGPYCKIPMELSKDSGLANGDVIRVQVIGITDERKFVEQYGFVPVGLYKEYTVEGLPSYFENMDDIPSEIYEQLKEQFNAYFEGYVYENWTVDEVLDSCTCVAQYFLVPESDNYTYNEKNVVYLLYQVDMHVKDGKGDCEEHKDGELTYYMYLRYDNVLDGEDVDPDRVRFSTRNFESDVYTRSFLSDKHYYSFVGYETRELFEEEIIHEFEKDGYVFEAMESNEAVIVTVSGNDIQEED